MMDVIEYADKHDAGRYPGRICSEINNSEFIQAFTDWCQDEQRHWSFESGANGYCGHTAYIGESYHPAGLYRFEFAYSGKEGFVKVFTANNDGYWVPEYISLEGEDARTLLCTLKTALLEVSGF